MIVTTTSVTTTVLLSGSHLSNVLGVIALVLLFFSMFMKSVCEDSNSRVLKVIDANLKVVIFPLMFVFGMVFLDRALTAMVTL